MQKQLEHWIRTLQLAPHPEGGYFKETYQSPDILKRSGLPARYTAERACAKAIYFLLPGDHVSQFHRLKSEEIWCYHAGDALTLYIIGKTGNLQRIKLGPNFDENEHFQVVIPHDVWFGAKVNKKNAYTLISCLTAPGFDFEDFELAEQQTLLKEYPQHKKVVEMLT